MAAAVSTSSRQNQQYRGRLAPSPSGYLHLGHARTFWTAQIRAQDHGGALVLRNEDLDPQRSKPEFVTSFIEDLKWFGFQWDEGPDCGGRAGPYSQSERFTLYRSALDRLIRQGYAYRCYCSRRDIRLASQAPHAGDEEPIYAGTCRKNTGPPPPEDSRKFAWRFRSLDGDTIHFNDARLGPQTFEAGTDFGDFVIWRQDEVPSYQLAVTVDDTAMAITEVVRGEDLLVSTARQLLLYRALDQPPPTFYHCPLMKDDQGDRLAKRSDSLSLRALREKGHSPQELRANW